MEINPTTYKIFKSGSVTFFTASLFFPKKVKQDVFVLYAFVRKFDDFIDNIPPEPEKYFTWKDLYKKALAGDKISNKVISEFVELQNKKNFEQKWVNAFFTSMEADIKPCQYQTLDSTLQYIHGSAEVIGLMMAKILDLDDTALPYAAKLGRAFQYMNMLRDISEDQSLGRVYLPKEEYQNFGLSDLTQTTAEQNSEKFTQFIAQEIKRYRVWRDEVKLGFKYIQKRYRAPISATTDMFDYTVDLIEKDPLVIYHFKIKPSRFRVAISVIKNLV